MQEGARLVALDPLPRDLERGLDEVGPRSLREAAVRLLEAMEETWNRNRALAHVERLRARVLEVDQHLVHHAQALRRDREEAVEQRGLAARLVHEQQPAGRGSGQRPLGHEGREGGGEERVDRVAALA
jgi:hypothetical protein